MTGSFLAGKLALVTGGSGTIGKAIAKALLTSGASVILTARGVEKLEGAKTALQEQIQTEIGKMPEIHVLPSDISKEESVTELFSNIDSVGNIDLVVNNAGEPLDMSTRMLAPTVSSHNFVFVSRYNGTRSNGGSRCAGYGAGLGRQCRGSLFVCPGSHEAHERTGWRPHH